MNFVGAGFNNTAVGFKTVSAYAAPGKNNTAVFNSTDGNDLLIASYLGAQYIGPGLRLRRLELQATSKAAAAAAAPMRPASTARPAATRP